MIFCAGLGTRLRPLTNDKPKAMVSLNGTPLLGHQINNLKAQGISEIIVNVHHFADSIIRYINAKDWGIPIRISDETNLLLDTGGGLKKAEKWLADEPYFLIHNVDIFSNIRIDSLLKYHLQSEAFATLAIRNRVTSRYLLFSEQQELCGWENTKSGEKIFSKPFSQNQNTEELKRCAFSGIHIVSSAIFDFLPKAEKAYSIIPSYLELAKSNNIQGYLHNEDFWHDVGTVEKLQLAETTIKNWNNNKD